MTSISNRLLLRDKSGPAVSALRKALAQALGDEAERYPGLLDGDQFDTLTESALRAWQAATGLVADGIAGPRTLAALGVLELPPLGLELDLAHVGQLFPCTRSSSIEKNLPYVAAALAAFGLCERELVIAALGTIRAETEGFVPIPEQPSHFNTWPGQATFSRYENLDKLGNSLPGDGARFRGRGYVQLTGRDNYDRFGKALDVDLLQRPDSACAPEVAACLLAAFLSAHRDKLSQAMSSGDLKAARRIVNGGSHGLDRFEDAVERALAAWPAPAARPGKAIAAKAAKAAKIKSPPRAKLDATQDPTDLRDRAYQPPPHSLPDRFPSDEDIRNHVSAYQRAGLVLDQGREGACTGFGLACVVNYLRWIRAGTPEQLESVSPRMLYQFARRNDEYAGEDYEGSSCRGALKGWYGNGVCLESDWRYVPGRDSQPSPGWDKRSIENTLGVYYRIQTHNITDLQAAISEVRAVYVSAFTHDGWDQVRAGKAPASHDELPVIAYDGSPSRAGGHAFALVGFNRQGFVIQNSWGSGWGAGGFALIRYDDWHDNAMDAWVAALGVPGVIESRLANGTARPQAQAGAAQPGWWDKTAAYRHSIVLGNNGRVDRYDTVDGVSRTLQHQACVLPDTWFRSNGQARKRLVLYAHGGLNSESDAIERVQAMGRYFLGNGCYPLFLVWKSGLLESITDIINDRRRKAPAGLAGAWLDDQVSDPLLEKLVGRPLARPLWSEMKENAELASHSGRGGDLLAEALNQLARTWGDDFELHLIGHSAGSIMLGRLLERLRQKDLADHVRSVHLYAPACTVGFANRYYAPHEDIMQRLYLHLLSDRRERDDNVGQIYRKSLLYFVSNALEADPRTPILGLQNVFKPEYRGWDGTASTNEDLLNWRTCAQQSKLADRMTVHDDERFTARIGQGDALPGKSISASHGGFDNNVEVIEQTLKRITGMSALTMAVDNLVGF